MERIRADDDAPVVKVERVRAPDMEGEGEWVFRPKADAVEPMKRKEDRVLPELVVALLDCHSICHAAKHKTKRLTFRGNKTGVIFGFLRTLLRLQEELLPDVWVFAWDSDSRSGVRRKAYPEYKINREEKTQEEKRLAALTYPQFNTLRDEVLPALGFANVLRLRGFEADDIIAQVVGAGNYLNRYLMVTRDGDFYQCLRPNVWMYDHVKSEFYTAIDFWDQWSIDPEQWHFVKAIAGCSTDHVEGVEDVGDITAAKMLAGTLGEHTKAFKKIMLPENQDIAERNVPLVILPHADTPPVTISETEQFSMQGLSEMANKYGLRSILKDTDWRRWKEAFNG